MANRFKDEDYQEYDETDEIFDEDSLFEEGYAESDDQWLEDPVMSEEEEIPEEAPEEEQEEEEPREEELIKQLLAERKKEIRNILLGNFVIYADGSYGAGNSAWVTPFGFGDGAQEAIFFGISHRKYHYTSTFRNEIKTLYQVEKSMQDVGRRLNLLTAPEADTCYVKSVFFRPVVLSFEKDKDEKDKDENGKPQFILHAYTSRSLTSFLAVKRAVSRFEKALPKQVRRAE